ncbi:MAG: UvrD-helicase domain-containing protein [Clostridiaceae bacterium]|nr:UvrD-helicase domain-containing protein [Clostridiaceae bacterium]
MLDLTFPHLNDKQREAVFATDGPLLILAGAGSGKTTVLINKVAYLLKSKNVQPYNILAITFTNKAAAELKMRLENMLGVYAQDIWASTFHSACVKILRGNIKNLDYPSQFNIYDTADQLTVIKECLRELNLSDKNFPPKQVLSAISRAKDELLTPDLFEQTLGGDYRFGQISKIYHLYNRKLKRYGAVDFDDIIMLTVQLFEQYPDVLSLYQTKFKYVLVDEYQDTNHAQYRLVSLLAGKHRNLCVVGDDDQSIYKFRGADIENILGFEKQFPEAKVIKLEENYRSTQTILDAANNIIKNNIGRKGKQLWTSKGAGDKIILYKGQTEYDEARYIVQQIEQTATSYNDFAVLYRMNSQSRVIEDALTRAAIPYRVLGGLRFYDRKEIKDAIAYLRVVFNKGDNVSLKRIINEPKRGIGATTVEKVEQIAAREEIDMFEVCKNANRYPQLERAVVRVRQFTDVIERLNIIQQQPLDAFVQEVLIQTGYIPALEQENSVESVTRLENIYEFISSAKEYIHTTDTPTLGEFLENISLVADIDNYDETQNAVVLMTLHSAKGLEFPFVFIAGAEEGVFPSYLSFSSNDELEEERRLCYVGVTRAKEQLYITHAATRTLFGATKHNLLSRFVEEIPTELIDRPASHMTAQPKDISSIYIPVYNQSKTAKPSKQMMSFSTGETVLHKKFGRGIILKAVNVGNDYHLEIAFDSCGTKQLMAAYANLTKVEN